MKQQEDQNLDLVLESAVVVSWADLIQSAPTALIHLEYDFAANGTLDYVRVWSSLTRGHWLLACEYWMSASRFHSTGIHFENGYRSEGLAHILESVMQHQSAFSLPADLGRQGLLQIQSPTEEEGKTAAASVREALYRVEAALAQTALA